jgi:hypothetical protein
MPNTDETLGQELRGLPRIRVHLPVILERGLGETLDISASGVYFETEEEPGAGSLISLRLELNHLVPGQVVQLECTARVVRVERREGKVGVAAAIERCQFTTVGHGSTR